MIDKAPSRSAIVSQTSRSAERQQLQTGLQGRARPNIDGMHLPCHSTAIAGLKGLLIAERYWKTASRSRLTKNAWSQTGSFRISHTACIVMYFSLVTKRSDTYKRRLYRRKGGGEGGGKGGGRGSGSGETGGEGDGSNGKSSNGISSGKSSVPINTGGTTRSATAYGVGGGPTVTIPSGQLFAGRLAGGGTRSQVYGNREYGSGYPGILGRGTDGRGFPFFFWPLTWGGSTFLLSSAYLHTTEYGNFDNTSRPGGIMMTAAFTSLSQNTTLRIVADNTTVSALLVDIVANCSSDILSPSTITSSTFNDSLPSPKPEQTVQYYRASTVALTLDGYNNTGALEADGTPDTPLQTNIDTNLLNCLNSTIGEAVPLINSANLQWRSPSIGVIGLIWVLWFFF